MTVGVRTAPASARLATRPARPPLDGALRPGACTGIGTLPHRSTREAAAFVLAEQDLPAVPSLPRRSPAEGMIAQAVLGIAGVTLGQYGSIAVDPRAVDPEAPIATDLDGDGFAGLRRFLQVAGLDGRRGPVKWQFVGPVSLGVALARVGVAADVAFAVAGRAVAAHLVAIAELVADRLPRSPQLVVLDEPWLGDLMLPGFPLPPEPAIDLVSGAMAAVTPDVTVGLHSCGAADIASLLAAGPDVLSVPVDRRLVRVAGYLVRFLEGGGRIAWGVVPTDGPIATGTDRAVRRLGEVWGELIRRGGDPAMLRARSIVTPCCGLGTHTPAVATQVCRATRDIGRRIEADAVPVSAA